MKLPKKLIAGQRGQGLIEYALIMVLVCFVFWVSIKDTNIGTTLAGQWSKITDCLDAPMDCASSE